MAICSSGFGLFFSVLIKHGETLSDIYNLLQLFFSRIKKNKMHAAASYLQFIDSQCIFNDQVSNNICDDACLFISHICVHTCTYVYICVHTCAYMDPYMYLYVHICTCMYTVSYTHLTLPTNREV